MNQHIKEAYLEQISTQFKTSGHWGENKNTKSDEKYSIPISMDKSSLPNRHDNISWFDINSLIDLILVNK